MLAKNNFETILIDDSIVAELTQYQNVWEKFLKLLKALNCGIGGNRIQHVLHHALNLPLFSNLNSVVVLFGTNTLLLDSPGDIADDISEIARSFKTNYRYVKVVTCGILPCDDSWSVNQVFSKDVIQILKLKLYKSYYTFVSYNSGWTLAKGSLSADLYYSDRLHLVEKGHLKLVESIFTSIEVSNDNICSNHNKFSKSYKMAVSFKLHNADFSPLSFPSASKPVSSVSASLPFITACKSFPHNINIRLSKSFAIRNFWELSGKK